MGYRLTQEAEHDIGSIAETGIELFGVDQAYAYHEALFHVFGLLADNPQMGRERMELSTSIRVHPFRSHIIIYRIDDAGVLIIRVRHSHEDWISEPV